MAPLLKGAVTEGDWGILFKLKVESGKLKMQERIISARLKNGGLQGNTSSVKTFGFATFPSRGRLNG